MTFLWRTFTILSFTILTLTAGDISCREWKAGVTECDPYSIKFLRVDKSKKSIQTIHNKPITQRVVPLAKYIKKENKLTLNGLIHKYINREERLYFSHKKIEEKSDPIKEEIKKIKNKKIKKEEIEKKKEIEKAQREKAKWKEEIRKQKIELKRKQEEEKRQKEKEQKRLAKNKMLKEREEAQKQKEELIKKQEEIKQEKEALKKREEEARKEKEVLKKKQEEVEQKKEKVEEPLKKIAKENQELNVSQEEPKEEFSNYTVVKGDSLIAIARKFGLEANTISKANSLNGKKIIHIGQKLLIPLSQEKVDTISQASYIVVKGDSLSSVARKFNINVKLLKKYNKLNKKSMIRIGQKLTLPLPHKIAEINRIEEKAKQERLRKKRIKIKKEREKLARIALKKQKAKSKKLLDSKSKKFKRKLRVQATAYTSHRGQTDKTPFLAAWNNRIRPGMKIIAVSRDLITSYGITNGSRVKISGLRGVYTVRDKMNKRWRKKIDIYMGTDRRRALRWGRRRVILYY